MKHYPKHFLAVLSGVILLALIGLAASRPAHSVSPGGPVPVQIVNNAAAPALTRDVDNGARQPFQQPFTMNFNAGSNDLNLADTPTLSVPTGKRLVIETVSVHRGFSARGVLNTEIDDRLNGSSIAYVLPPVAANGADNPGILQPVRLYAEGDQAVILRATRSDSTLPESVGVSISGYLVDIP